MSSYLLPILLLGGYHQILTVTLPTGEHQSAEVVQKTEEFAKPNSCSIGSTISLSLAKLTTKQNTVVDCYKEGPLCERSLSRTNEEIVPPHALCSSELHPFVGVFGSLRYIFVVPSRTKNITLHCGVCGSPSLHVTWYRVGRSLPRVARCSVHMPEFSLRLGAATKSKCGMYMCIARNADGQTYASSICVTIPGKCDYNSCKRQEKEPRPKKWKDTSNTLVPNGVTDKQPSQMINKTNQILLTPRD